MGVRNIQLFLLCDRGPDWGHHGAQLGLCSCRQVASMFVISRRVDRNRMGGDPSNAKSSCLCMNSEILVTERIIKCSPHPYFPS